MLYKGYVHVWCTYPRWYAYCTDSIYMLYRWYRHGTTCCTDGTACCTDGYIHVVQVVHTCCTSGMYTIHRWYAHFTDGTCMLYRWHCMLYRWHMHVVQVVLHVVQMVHTCCTGGTACCTDDAYMLYRWYIHVVQVVHTCCTDDTACLC